MMRILYTSVFLLLTSLVYSQKSTLVQNVNVRANELKHHLNKTGDSLILEGERTIYKVEIFNDDFEQSTMVKDSKVIIPLHNIPVGRFVVEAALPDKLIVITLLRNESLGTALAINTTEPKRTVSLFGDRPAIANNSPKPNKKVSLFGDRLLKPGNKTITPEKHVTEAKLVEVDKKVNFTDKMATVAYKKPTITAKNITLTDNKVIVEDNKTSVIDEKITLTDNKTTVIDKNVTVADNKITEIDKKITVANNKIMINDKKVNVADNKTSVIDKNITLADNKTTVIDKKIALTEKKATTSSLNATVSDKKLISSKNIINNSGRRVVESYWIVYKTNGHTSGKEMRFGDQKLVNKMISHINLDKRTKAGKYNELIVWEIYDVSKFLKYKLKNHNNLSSEAECFNVVPFYKTKKDSTNP